MDPKLVVSQLGANADGLAFCAKEGSTLFFPMDPKLVVSQLEANAEALAITSIVLGGATGSPVVSSMSVSVQGQTRDINAPNSQEHHGRPGIGSRQYKGWRQGNP